MAAERTTGRADLRQRRQQGAARLASAQSSRQAAAAFTIAPGAQSARVLNRWRSGASGGMMKNAAQPNRIIYNRTALHRGGP
jgi:hypothetical protein